MSAILWVVAIAVAVMLAGVVYQCVGAVLDRRRLMTTGRLVEISDGRRLYLIEKGPQGRGPTVVFESGFAATSLNWSHIQEALVGKVHTVAYDRCGMGWSGPARTERTPKQVAAEMRAMLRAAGVEGPWVLVGHSFGGLVMQRFALDYGAEVAGLVLVDPMRTHEWPPVNVGRTATLTRARRMTRVGLYGAPFGIVRLAARSHFCHSASLSRWLVRVGGTRARFLADRLDTEIGKMPLEVRASIAAHWSAPRFYRGLLAHLSAVPATVEEMHDVHPMKDVPVVVLTPATTTPVGDMRRFGAQSREVIAERSRHWVHLDEPDLVVRTILEMVASVSPNSAGVAARAGAR